MNPIRSKHIFISLFVAFIIFILVRANQDDYSVENSGIHNPLQSKKSCPSLNSEQPFSQYHQNSPSNNNLNRHEILQKKLKGYRETVS